MSSNPFALAVPGGGLPAVRSVDRSYDLDTPTREEQHIAHALRTQVSVIDAWRAKSQFAAAELGHMNAFGVQTFQRTLYAMADASRLHGAPEPLQALMGQFVEAQAVRGSVDDPSPANVSRPVPAAPWVLMLNQPVTPGTVLWFV